MEDDRDTMSDDNMVERVRLALARWLARVPQKPKVWGQNDDGTPYVVGKTVGELRQELDRFNDADEVCMAVCSKKNWNGGGYLGKSDYTGLDG